ADEHHPGPRVDAPDPRRTGRALRAPRVHDGHRLGDRFVRPVGRGTRQGARAADRARTAGGIGTGPASRLVHERPDPSLPRRPAASGWQLMAMAPRRVYAMAFAAVAWLTLPLAAPGAGAVVSQAAPGRLDRTFSGNGKVYVTIGSPNDYLNAVAIQPDGDI